MRLILPLLGNETSLGMLPKRVDLVCTLTRPDVSFRGDLVRLVSLGPQVPPWRRGIGSVQPCS